jgi:hypothetical protein
MLILKGTPLLLDQMYTGVLKFASHFVARWHCPEVLRAMPSNHHVQHIKSGQLVRLAFLIGLCWSIASAAFCGDPFADGVVSFRPGIGAGFGQTYFPENVLGPPCGNESPTIPQASEQHLLSLGDGGEIVLEFSDNIVIDLPGADLAVFENPLIAVGDVNYSFCEAAIVAVSQDGDTFFTFPYDFIPPPEGERLGRMSDYINFAGIHPVFSNPTNGISAIDPAVSGGDFFDLADVGLAWARFVRITDTGTPGTPTETRDSQGDVVDDPGNAFRHSVRNIGI